MKNYKPPPRGRHNRKGTLTMYVSRMLSLFMLPMAVFSPAAFPEAEETPSVPFEISLDTILEHDDGTFLWFHPRATSIPPSEPDGQPGVLITLQKHLQVSDFYSGLYMMYSKDLGKTWSGPTEIPELAWRDGPDDTIRAVCDVTPGYHEPTGKVLAIGAQLYYKRDGNQFGGIHRANQTAYAVYDPVAGNWSSWRELKMPADPKFDFSRCACAQWLVESDGRLLLPLYFGINDQADASVTIASCTFDGKELSYVEHGTEMTVTGGRGLCEPSLARFKDRYFLTLRNDSCGYVTSSADGLHFDSIRPWRFDDGTELGSYNTQQHWITHPKGLFLVYTRRGANNDHVFRHRAPLFLGQVNPDTLQVIRATERVVIPERGATLGNFGASRINAYESWITVGEGIWNDEIRARGAKGSLYLARIVWE
ncbi:MAG TPA: sialidase family protein [Candidatus Hydrogenedentes bacterium]|nr:sialidase family protein [Candidatus Hydrogenedentota bacterium]